MNEKDKELLAGFHQTISEQLDSRLSESPQFFGLLVVVATGYAYVLANPKLDLLPLATKLSLGATAWAGWYLAALGYAFRYLQVSQHRIEHELDWTPFAFGKTNPAECHCNPFWLLPGIYHAHAAGLIFFLILICFTGFSGCWPWVGSAGGIFWITGINLFYLVKFENRIKDK